MRFYILFLFICFNVFASENCYESLHGFTGQKLSDSQVELVVKFLAQNGHYLKARNNSEELTKLLKSEFDLEVSMITLYRRAKAQDALIKDPNPVTNRNKIKITKERVELLLSKIEEQGISFGRKSFEVENKSKVESIYKELTGESVAGKSLYNWINKNLSLPSSSRKGNEEIKRILSDEVITGNTIYENRNSLRNLFFKYKGFKPSNAQIQDYVYRYFYELRHFFSFYRVTENFQSFTVIIRKNLEQSMNLELNTSEAKDHLREELQRIYGNDISEVRMLQWIDLIKESLGDSETEKSLYNWVNKNLSKSYTSHNGNDEIKKVLSDEAIKGKSIYENRETLIDLFSKYKGIKPSQSQLQFYVYYHFYDLRHYFSFYGVTSKFKDRAPIIKNTLEENNYLHLQPREAKEILRKELLKIYGDHVSEIRMLQWIEVMNLEAIDFYISKNSLKAYEWFKTVQKGFVFKDERIRKVRKEEGFEIVHEDAGSSPEDIVIGIEEITSDFVIEEMNIKDARVMAYLRATIDHHIFDPYEIAKFYEIPVQDVVFGMNWLASNPDVREALIEMLGG